MQFSVAGRLRNHCLCMRSLWSIFSDSQLERNKFEIFLIVWGLFYPQAQKGIARINTGVFA